ncbi:MAG: erythromycin esterase family protein [Burkholderiales bacterium]|nr:erythromycin esterase family protein [Burkholderiales bacterium]
MIRACALFLLLFSGSVAAALPGVREFSATPEALGDAELSVLFGTSARNADVVAIGETVHGSAGLLRVQTRLIRHLVEQQGMRLIVWETAVLRSRELAQWLAACASGRTPSDAAPPIDVLYFPVEADGPLWRWACRYNAANPRDPVIFRGMDVWDRPWEHHRQIRDNSARLGLPAVQIAAIDKHCASAGARDWAEADAALARMQQRARLRDDAGLRACQQALELVLEAARVIGREAVQDEPRREGAYELALSASTLQGWLGFHHYAAVDDVASWNERDRAQGRNLMLLMERHAVPRAVLAAHISHVSHNRSPADWWQSGDLKSGVYFFQKLSGRRVFNVALTAYKAAGAQGDWLEPRAADSMDRALHEAGHRFAWFSGEAAFLSGHPRWWLQNGNAIGMENGISIVPRDHFDAYVFIDQSPLEGLLPARPVWQP